LPVPAVALAVAGIAEALQAIHGADIVHRDLKPSNVLLAADGPRVIDFGIARAADATSLTRSGAIVGTPAFMTPEQASGAACAPATDIFALGQVAVYAATGTPAFGEGTSHAVLYRIVHEAPDLADLPDELNELVTRCLAKDPSARPTPAEIIDLCQRASPQTELRRPDGWLPPAVAADIDRHTAALVPPPQQLRNRGRIALAVAAVLVAGLAGVGITAMLGDGGGDSQDGPNTSKRPSRTSSSPSNSPETAPSSSPETTTPPDPNPVQYKVDLPRDYSLRFADDPPKPIEGGLYDEWADFGITLDGDEFHTNNAMVLLINSQVGSLKTCRAETRYAEFIPLSSVSKGTQICVTAGTGHIGLITIRGFSPENAPNQYVTLDLTIWRNAAEPVGRVGDDRLVVLALDGLPAAVAPHHRLACRISRFNARPVAHVGLSRQMSQPSVWSKSALRAACSTQVWQPCGYTSYSPPRRFFFRGPKFTATPAVRASPPHTHTYPRSCCSDMRSRLGMVSRAIASTWRRVRAVVRDPAGPAQAVQAGEEGAV
ncbi:serine/threonine-protein kinase, partial [Streptomyces sp. NPDC002920]